MSHHQLPPLPAIRVFEAAARHLSFTRAAEELGMTQAAVSYQIKLLEERIGSPLFHRRPRQVTLTPAGLKLAPQVSEAFERLQAAFAELRTDTAGTLAISCVHTFATNWLASRIGRFQIANPDLAIRLEASSEVIDFARHPADLALRSGSGDWPGLVSHRLLDAVFTPMLSPALADSIGGVEKPADLARLPIISPGDPWWRIWLEKAGVDPGILAGRQPYSMGAQVVEAEVAMAGGGVGLLTPAFYQRDLAAGRLIQPFDIIGDSGIAYWLVYPESRRNLPKIRRFRDWILSEIGQGKDLPADR